MLFLLASVAGLATWSTQRAQRTNHSLEQRATVVGSLGDARAHFFIGTTLLIVAGFVDDASPVIDSYLSTIPIVDNDLAQARGALVTLNEPDQLEVLEKLATDVTELSGTLESIIPFSFNRDKNTRLAVVVTYIPQLWPRLEAMMEGLEQLADQQQSKLVAERASATHSSDLILGTLIAFSLFAFLTAAGTLVFLVASVVRPLTALQESAKAIAAGDWAAQAKVSGPQEVTSLADDFNVMTQALLNQTEQLQESEQRFRDVLDVSRDFIYKLNLPTGMYDYVSPSVFPMSGFTPEEFSAMGFEGVYKRFHPEDKKRIREFLRRFQDNTLEGDTVTTIEYRWKRKDGEYYWASDNGVLICDPDGKPIARVGSARDITAQKQAEEALREQARRDPLTGILNHGAIVSELTHLVASGNEGPPAAVAMTDVNGLKTINDKYGHQMGDASLIAVARALSQEGALVGRYGGDEFVTILPGASREDAKLYCKQVRNAMAGIQLIDQETGDRVSVMASIGLAFYPEDAQTVIELVKLSDSAMYAQKRQRPIDRAA